MPNDSKKTPNVNAQDKWEKTPLHYAAEKGHIGVVNPLIKAEADVNAQDEQTMMTLHEAARNGHIDIVTLLLAKGADTTLTNNKSETAEQIAAQSTDSAISDCFQQHKQAVEKIRGSFNPIPSSQLNKDKGEEQKRGNISGADKAAYSRNPTYQKASGLGS